MNHLSALQSDIKAYLQTDIRADTPTGLTPRKREWPRDRLLPLVDLDGERPTVLELLLQAKRNGHSFDSLEPVHRSEEEEDGDEDGEQETELVQDDVDEYASPTPPPPPPVVGTPIWSPATDEVPVLPFKPGMARTASALSERDQNSLRRSGRARAGK
jgi:hypothetical protein